MGVSNLLRKPQSVISNSYKTCKSSIESLPHELLTEILVKTTDSSYSNIFNAKLASRSLNKAGDDNYVHKKMSLKKLPLVSWKKVSDEKKVASISFLERCKMSGNREALYRQGVMDFFGVGSTTRIGEESGIEALEQAAKLEHYGAYYTLGMIYLLSNNHELRKEGVTYITELKRSNTSLSECRENLKSMLSVMWLRDQRHWQRFNYCNMKEEHMKLLGWKNDKDDTHCDACQCEKEVTFFLRLFPYV